MASLDDIWDEPAETSSHPKSPPRAASNDDDGSFSPPPSKRPGSSRPLFYDSNSDDDAPSGSKTRYASKPASSKPDIDAFFADLDNDDPDTAFHELAPSLDVAALKRQADAKLALTPHQILPSSSPPRDLGDEEKGGAKGKAGEKDKKGAPVKKKKRAVLDEARLVGPDGFPALMKQAKEFKPKGKGHELQDLNRLMNVYQFWTHKMYPNTQFIDTVQRVEKLCHSKRMHVALSVWRDEAHGLISGRKVPGPDDPLGNSDSDADSDNEGDASNKRRTRAQTEDVPVATEDERSSPARSPRGATLPPSSPSSGRDSSLGALDDDFDIDAMIREDEQARAQAASSFTSRGGAPAQGTYGAPRSSAVGATAAEADEDEAMWDAVMDDFPDEPYVPPARPEPSVPAPPPAPATRSGGGGVEEDMDEDMWDMVREMDMDAPAPAIPKAAPPPQPEQAAARDGGGEGTETGEGGVPAGALVGVDPSRKATNDEGWDEMYA
ncbi:Swi3-domain-containing protein [Trametes cingulata]|nr:Swi3-domain-containing protein [Trametes cingulata]